MSNDVVEGFGWDDQRDKAAVLLAQGYNNSQTAREVGVNKSTIGRWLDNKEFEKAVDELSVTYGLASKAHRLRLLNQAIRQKTEEDGRLELAGVTFLDLIKEARMQTEGIKLGLLNTLIAADETAGTLARGGPTGSPSLPESSAQETE
jgi:transposase-like protein